MSSMINKNFLVKTTATALFSYIVVLVTNKMLKKLTGKNIDEYVA